MTALDIINKGKVAVRNSGSLYPIYQNLFKEAFGFEPECPTCGSANGHRHWSQFESFAYGADPKILILKTEKMSNTKTFEVKQKSKIFSYLMEKGGRQIIVRQYGDVMTEAFAQAYLKTAEADAEVFAKRKAEFNVLPVDFRKKADKVVGDKAADKSDKVYPAKLADKKTYAASLGYPEADYKSITSKADMDAYLDAAGMQADAAAKVTADQDAATEEDLSDAAKTDEPVEGADDLS